MLPEIAQEYIQNLDKPQTTKRTYAHGLSVFATFAQEAKYADEPASFPPDALVAFKRWLQARGYKPRTVLNYLVAAKNLLRWLDNNDRMANDAQVTKMERRLKGNGNARTGGYVARPIDPAIAKLMGYYVNIELPDKQTGRLVLLRNRALMAFLYDTAARVSEALALTRADVADGRADKVVLYKTKGDKPRTVFLNEQTQRLIREYVAERQDRSNAPLFASHGRRRGGALSAHQAWVIVKEAAKAEGLLDSTSPHCLRHKRAQDLLDEGMPLEWITMLLGHESPGTTKTVYAPHVNAHLLGDMLKEYGKGPLDAE